MTLAVDAIATHDENVGTGDYDWTHTPVAGTPQGVLVYTVATTANPVPTGSSVTYGALPMTQIGSAAIAVDLFAVSMFAEAWWLDLNDQAGAQTVTVTYSSTPSGNRVFGTSISYTTGAIDTPIAIESFNDDATGDSTSPTDTITIANDSHISAVVCVPEIGSPVSIVADAPLTQIYEDDFGIRLAATAEITGISSPGTYNTKWTLTGASPWAILNVAVKEGLPNLNESWTVINDITTITPC